MRRRFGLGGVLLLALLVCPVAAGAVSQEEAATQIAERFGVRVLDVKPGDIDGRAVWLVTVMKEAGNRNDAFQVTRLAVDRESGALLPSFRHRASGYDLPDRPASGNLESIRPDAARSGTWR